MKKKIDSNGYVNINLDQKTKIYYRFKQNGLYEKGSSTSLLHGHYNIKSLIEKTISFQGKMKYVDVRGSLSKNREFIYDEHENYKFQNFYLRLFAEDVNGEIFGEVAFMEGDQYENEVGKVVKVPPEVEISIFVPKKTFEIFEKKYLENDKDFFKKLSFSFGVFYDFDSRQKNLGKGIRAEEQIHEVSILPITNYNIDM